MTNEKFESSVTELRERAGRWIGATDEAVLNEELLARSALWAAEEIERLQKREKDLMDVIDSRDRALGFVPLDDALHPGPSISKAFANSPRRVSHEPGVLRPMIDVRVYEGNDVLVDCVELTKYVTARVVAHSTYRKNPSTDESFSPETLRLAKEASERVAGPIPGNPINDWKLGEERPAQDASRDASLDWQIGPDTREPGCKCVVSGSVVDCSTCPIHGLPSPSRTGAVE